MIHMSTRSTKYDCLVLCFFICSSNSKLQPSFPKLSWEPLTEVQVTERGLSADPSKQNLFKAAQKVKHLTPAIGTEIHGVDLRQLSEAQKDEL